MKEPADIEVEVFREKLNAARKELIDLVVWQRHIREQISITTFGRTTKMMKASLKKAGICRLTTKRC